MPRSAWSIVVLILIACHRSAPTARSDQSASASSMPSPAASSIAPSSSGARDSGLGFAFGHASSGPGHVSMSVSSQNGPKGAEFGSLFRDLTACYKASPHRDAKEAVRVTLHVTVSATGTSASTATATIGILADKGRGEQGYAFSDAPPKNDGALVACVNKANHDATVTVPNAFRDASFDVRIELSP